MILRTENKVQSELDNLNRCSSIHMIIVDIGNIGERGKDCVNCVLNYCKLCIVTILRFILKRS